MASQKVVVEGSNAVSASQLKDFFRQIDDRTIGGVELQAFLEHRNPFVFDRDEHGNVAFTVTGLDLTGAQEIARLEALGYFVSETAKACFLSKEADGYDTRHRLVVGKQYRIVLIPGWKIQPQEKRTTENVQKYALQFGYHNRLAGIMPRIREAISNKQMNDMGISYIHCLHDPIYYGRTGMIFSSTAMQKEKRFVVQQVDTSNWAEHSAFPVVDPNF